MAVEANQDYISLIVHANAEESMRIMWSVVNVICRDSVELNDSCSIEEPTQNRFELKVSSKCWAESFVPMIMRFFEFIRNMRSRPVLRVSGRSFFGYCDCLPFQKLALKQFSLGNLVNSGIYFPHYERAVMKDSSDQIRRCRKIQSFFDSRHDHSLTVEFEHDAGVLSVWFAMLDGGSSPPSASKHRDQRISYPPEKGSLYKLGVKYPNILRIVVCCLEESEELRALIYLHLNYPPLIKRYTSKDGMRSIEERKRWFPSEHGRLSDISSEQEEAAVSAISESPILCLDTEPLNKTEFWMLLARLQVRTAVHIEFTLVEHKASPRYVPSPVRCIGCDHRPLRDGIYPNPPVEPPVDFELEKKIRLIGGFALEYLFAALLSRGAVVKDQILCSVAKRDEFVNYILSKYEADQQATENALEWLLNSVDEMREMPDLLQHFKDNFSLNESATILKKFGEEKGGYRRVRKILVTPTRMLLIVPELLMGNRVLRKFDRNGCKTIRIQFRDDDSSPLRSSSCGHDLVRSTVFNVLVNGIYIGDRHFMYLASSNSQMRDGGCYFFDDSSGDEIVKIRKELGIFDLSNIPKLMARMGQTLTQSMKCKVELLRKKYNTDYDITGGKDLYGKPHVFSDGVGRISQAFAEKVAKDLNLGRCVPSCYQFRHRGLKGVLCVDPSLDDRREWAKENGVEDNVKDHEKTLDLDVLFRPSQMKFHAPRSTDLEIVKYSSPTPVCLNRPMICILDQVSGMQGHGIHKRMKNRIHALLERQLMELADILMNEDKCRSKLRELPYRIGIDHLSTYRGFALTEEPFFRSLLKAYVKLTLRKSLYKEQIQIPANLGRSMFGVVDENGTLQYGQVFIQYVEDITRKLPSPNDVRKILKGPVLITKNPAIVAGDIRIFEAVDVAELRHLVDVVVFSRYGPRPQPDEMAGSDLDGDEYSVIWDDQLLFDHNEEPLDFTKDKREDDDVSEEEMDLAMKQFFVKYIELDSIGRIANAFLANGDLYGINSDVCLNIARKHSQAVDFPKTGIPPETLETRWKTDANDKKLPPERPERFPDCMDKMHEPCYYSPRLIGELYREIKHIINVHDITEQYRRNTDIFIDEKLCFPGWERYKIEAISRLNSYSASMRAILENYGVEDEGQLFSGFITELRNRISAKDNDDMTLFNTGHMIEIRVSEVFREYRREFFEEFGGFKENTVCNEKYVNRDGEDEDRRYCINSSDNMKRKASAYYIICYEQAGTGSEAKCFLSFGWLAWDVLAEIRDAAILSPDTTRDLSAIDPFNSHASKFIENFCRENEEEMKYFNERFILGTNSIKLYCKRYNALGRGEDMQTISNFTILGLLNLMFVLCKWGDVMDVFDGYLRHEHLCLILIQFGLGRLTPQNMSYYYQFLEEIDDTTVGGDPVVELDNMFGGIGVCFLKFLQYIGSRSFAALSFIDFSRPGIGYPCVMRRREWASLNRIALKSFWTLVLTRDFEGLFERQLTNETVTEFPPFVIENPNRFRVKDDKLRQKMLEYTGMRSLQLRRIPEKPDRMWISCAGTLEAREKLRNLIAVRPPLNSLCSMETRSAEMAAIVIDRILPPGS